MRKNMRDLLSKVILVSLDASAIFTAVCLAYLLREALDSYFFATHSQPLANYMPTKVLIPDATTSGMRAGRSSKHSVSPFLS